MSNYHCGETSLTYLTGGVIGRNAYRIIFIIAIFLGGIVSVDIMWNIADLFCAILVCINMILLVLLGDRALALAKDYFEQRDRGIDMPTFNSKGKKIVDSNIPIIIATQVLNEGTDLPRYTVGNYLSKKSNIIENKNMTIEATMTKLMYALGRAKTTPEIFTFFKESIQFDYE